MFWKYPSKIVCPNFDKFETKLSSIMVINWIYRAFACSVGDLSLILGSGRSPGEGQWQPTPVFLPGEFHGQKSLVGCSPWGHKGSDTTEQLTHTHRAFQIR